MEVMLEFLVCLHSPQSNASISDHVTLPKMDEKSEPKKPHSTLKLALIYIQCDKALLSDLE